MGPFKWAWSRPSIHISNIWVMVLQCHYISMWLLCIAMLLTNVPQPSMPTVKHKTTAGFQNIVRSYKTVPKLLHLSVYSLVTLGLASSKWQGKTQQGFQMLCWGLGEPLPVTTTFPAPLLHLPQYYEQKGKVSTCYCIMCNWRIKSCILTFSCWAESSTIKLFQKNNFTQRFYVLKFASLSKHTSPGL